MGVLSIRSSFVFFVLVFVVHVLLTLSIAAEDGGFSYIVGSGKGPEDWGRINPLWQACGNGKLQSPIDLLNEKAQVSPELGGLKTEYKPVPATLKNRGHDIAVFWKEYAGQININGTYYKLVQCHWHSPSEHTFNGERFALELHVVHESSGGGIAVIGIVYKNGQPDPLLEKLLEPIKAIDKQDIDLGVIDPGIIKFGSGEYYRYIGSLTTPPCTEGVPWTIVREVGTVSNEQVEALKEAVDDGFEANSRPTQQLNDRAIWLYTPSGTGGAA
ncbi:hypothetical protein BT93_B1744 [Corymbia citriodora subsp. variegata]|nr:hypothetical protein BT93_B1744 [Corymbia citriodora subsp. variegata]